ncbi:hypothetical protein ABEB36_005514 [Hypothenemus hampei]|uniref:MADF domain-containing protein n=1 Tax=Hypothenemus hampei TaxID=57062 RepID=A0ABD1F2B3_HYPHA
MSQKAKNLCRFTRELDEKLIELVSENEVLYNTNHKCYKDLTVRDDVWLAISSIVGKTVPDCKTRWRSLRDLYHRKKKEQKSGKKLRSSWEYMEAMKFLEKFTSERKPLQNDTLEEPEPEDIKMEIKLELQDNDFPTPSTSSHNGNTIIEESPSPKRSRFEDTHILYENSTVLHLLTEIRDLAKTKENPTMAFFDSMAKTVIRFPPAQAAEVKLKVCQLVTEMECKILEESGNYPDNLESFD